MATEILNAEIKSVTISMADHGCLTFGLNLLGDGWGVMFGGYCIGHGYLGAKEFKVESGDGLEAIMRIMDTVGVDRWEDLEGKYIRVISQDGWGSGIKKIGNMIKDQWFDIDEFFKTKVKEHKNENS